MSRIFIWTLFCVAPVLSATEVDPDLLSGMAARSLGPAGMSGRVTVVDAVVDNPNEIWVGAASGGVWKSEDGAVTFKPVFDNQPVHAIGSLAIFQPNPKIVWVGTGEGFPRNSASLGNGVYRTTDGGETWSHLGLDESRHISRVIAHTSDPDTAWVAVLGDMWADNPMRGVYKTSDGGKTWNRVLYVDEKTGCADLAIDPKNPDKLFAAMWEFRRLPHFFTSGGPGSGLYLTQDSGSNWKRLDEKNGLPAGDLGRIGLAIAHSDPSVVYAQMEGEENMLIGSRDGGTTWSILNKTRQTWDRPFYFSRIGVDTENPDRIYRLDLILSVSDDGGREFRQLEGAGWGQVHVDHHAIWVNPKDARHFLIGNDGGLVQTRNRGATFRFIPNLPISQLYHVAVDMDLPYNLYLGMQDNGTWRGPNTVNSWRGVRNHEWKMIGYGDGFDTLPDPDNSRRGFSLGDGGYLMRWDLDKGTVEYVKPAPQRNQPKYRYNWDAGLAADPHRKGTVYFGSQFIHRSWDYGKTWSIISPDLTTNNPQWQRQDESGGLTPDVTGAENYTTITVIAPSPIQEDIMWAGTDDGHIHVSLDAGGTWTNAANNLKDVPEHIRVAHLQPSYDQAGEAFVALDHHRTGDYKPYIRHTTDFGKSWRALSTEGVRGYALAIVQDPINHDLLFLGTEWGMWFSLDRGASWVPWRHGFSTASVMDLVIHPREHDLVVGTHGRGVYIIDDINPLRRLTPEILKKPLHVFTVPDARQRWFRTRESGMAMGATEYYGENRPYGAIITFAVADPKQEKARVVIDIGGKQIRSFEVPVKAGINRAVWDLRRQPFSTPKIKNNLFNMYYEEIAPEVIPGVYRATIKLGDHEEKVNIRVISDPHVRNSLSQWRALDDAIGRLGRVNVWRWMR